MRNIIRFVSKAAALTPGTAPHLTGCLLRGGRAQCFNGTLAIDFPFPSDQNLDILVAVQPLLTALEGGEGRALEQTSNGLRIKGGELRVDLIAMDAALFPSVAPEEAKPFSIQPEFLQCLAVLRQFMPKQLGFSSWQNGLLLKNGFAYATNDVILAKMTAPWSEQAACIPAQCIDVLLQTTTPLIAATVTDNAVSFFFENGGWLTTVTLSTDWPKELSGYVDSIPDLLPTIENKAVFERGIEELLQFCPDGEKTITFNGDEIATLDGPTSAVIKGCRHGRAKVSADQLLDVLKAASCLDLSKWPSPMPFRGENGLCGVIAGLP